MGFRQNFQIRIYRANMPRKGMGGTLKYSKQWLKSSGLYAAQNICFLRRIDLAARKHMLFCTVA